VLVGEAERFVRVAWEGLGDPRRIREMHETSAHVSTNVVFRVVLDDSSHVVAKASSYGSYHLFAEDHDRLFECAQLLEGTRWRGFLADVIAREGRPYRWYDGSRWVVFYRDVERGEQLPAILDARDVANLAEELADFHRSCADIAPHLPASSHSLKVDCIRLLDVLSQPSAGSVLGLAPHDLDVVRRSTDDLLDRLDAIGFDRWSRIPVLVDWNLGNFSVRRDEAGGRFRLFSRWDYDWFRIDTRMLDFYFLSRVSSETGDRTTFTYSPHTLVEPRFVHFLRAYHASNPLSEDEIRFLPLAYRFFILNYVVREGAKFFQPEFAVPFRREAARTFLPMLDGFDVAPALAALC
jgi:hypothetical protein